MLKWQIVLSKVIEANRLASDKEASTQALGERLSKTHDALRKEIAQLESTLNRLQLYLLPRVTQRDPVAIIAAEKRAEADLQELRRATAECTTDCAKSGHGDDPTNACAESCVGSDLVARLRACKNPSWLPF